MLSEHTVSYLRSRLHSVYRSIRLVELGSNRLLLIELRNRLHYSYNCNRNRLLSRCNRPSPTNRGFGDIVTKMLTIYLITLIH